MNSPGPATGSRRAKLIAALLLALSLGLARQTAAAHIDLWGSIGALAHHHWVDDGASRATGVVEGRLDVQATLGRAWRAFVALEPRAHVELAGAQVAASLNVPEAFAAYRAGAGDFLVGRLILPVETARLTLPYALTPPDETGRRRGLNGARADLYLGPSRLQAAAVHDGDRWTPLAALRLALPGWEATGHLIFQEKALVAGLGWSGLIGSVVAYGEIWSVPGESSLRYSAGASGYLGDFLWTGELARAPLMPGVSPAPQVALQVAYAPIPGLRLTVDAALATGEAAAEGSGDGATATSDAPAYRWGVAAAHELVPGESELELTLGRLALPFTPATLTGGLGIRWFF